ncbi:signal peptide-containing protein [Theileria equi strain WA]|uniref:Signal peptide-containing protein n=1 Tax=Theileria equi strain WA TaxID=1537102 RepID=L0AYK2_THEEQ|nr:signal peptide-containing protein [Theileria equi strain WA]AFZ80645.1 signal peptide-containing protein [Theileria equi strain WA]|eukprot:XP_004830311.1 signal peptide-containing protein [Theileria equi strain WA]
MKVFSLLMILLATKSLSIPGDQNKMLIDLDISGRRPCKIEVSPSGKFIGGINHTVRKNSKHTHIIGSVMDGDKLITPGDPTAMSRYVLNTPEDNGFRYVRVITRYRVACSYLTYAEEFVKMPNSDVYRAINREPLILDILEQKEDDNIRIDILPERSIHQGNPGHPQILPTCYSIKSEVELHKTIGEIRYGNYVIDDRVGGLMCRMVRWEGDIGSPIITIVSTYNDWTQVEMKYEYLIETCEVKMQEYKRKNLDLLE